MNIIKTVNAKSLFNKKDSIVQIVPSKFSNEELLKSFVDFFSGFKSLDYEFRNRLKVSINEQVISSDVYQVYYSAKARYEVEIKVKCKTGVNLDIVKNNFAKLISDHYPNLESKEEASYDQVKKIFTVKFASSTLKNYYEDESIKEIVSVHEQSSSLQECDVKQENVEIIGLTLNKHQIDKKVEHDLIVFNKDLIKNKFKSYDYKITSIKVKQVVINQYRYILIPLIRYIVEDKFYAMVNKVNSKVTIDYSNMPISGDVKYRLLEISNYDKFNTNMLFFFYLILVSSICFWPFMKIDELLESNINIYLALGICIFIGALVGFIRAVRYSLKNHMSMDRLADVYDKGDYEGIKNKRKDKKVMLITGTLAAGVIAIVLIIMTFVTFG